MSAVEQFVKIPSPPVGFRTRQNTIKTSAVRLLFGVQSTTAFQQALGDDISMESYNRLVELYHEAQREFMVELIHLEPSLFYDKLITAKPYRISSSTSPEFFVFIDESAIRFRDIRTLSMCELATGTTVFRSEANRSRDFEEFLRLRVVRFFSPPAVRARAILISCPLPYGDDAVSADPKTNQYPGSNCILILDDTDIHRSRGITRMCQDAGVQLIYLPTGWSGLNPIEACISLIKQDSRRNQALVNNPDPASTIRQTAERVITPELCRTSLHEAGYNGLPWEH
ncbi:hypothetical protein PSHT_02494 [Puccinia striiformis]|uniref:Tc1-like transposase DDE domain-containing protein n=1 Tax=Puccinia striiformis TaxID=27350 RepID=A0A2S4WI45_9BASI|nr:hypothetical protein PSHT_02494 [Puccinia striiformis]